MQKASEKKENPPVQFRVACWLCRIAFFLVFAINVDCAVSYVISPQSYMGGFGLSGIEGKVAVAGLGIAFLMWNATYPVFIIRPAKSLVLGAVIIAQQIIGLIGESCLYMGYGLADTVMSGAILRFIMFDGGGLIIMACTYIFLLVVRSRVKEKDEGA